MKRVMFTLVFTVTMFFVADYSFSALLYVNHAAEGNNDGSSWEDAYLLLQSALDSAVSGDEIWVAEGTYYPTKQVGGEGERYKALQLKNGVAIYGGFAGNETEREDRDWNENPTILSGDIGEVNDSTDNCYHIFYHPSGLNLDSTAVLDGFVLEKANANGSSDAFRMGAAIYNISSSPIFSNCIIRNHTSDRHGGAIYNSSSSPIFDSCNIINNKTLQSGYHGGGVYNYSGSPVFTNCEISGNTGSSGGGVYNYTNSSATYTNCEISGNTSGSNGGGVLIYGSSPIFSNCVISGNTSSTYGSGVYNDISNPNFINCEISRNYSSSIADGVNNYYSDPTFTNCVISGNSNSGVSNFMSDPSFTNCEISGNTRSGVVNLESWANFTDCEISGNTGGGVKNSWCAPGFTNCVISGNTSSLNGGGVYNFYSDPTFTNCVITGNTGTNGGGVCNQDYSDPTFTDCEISGNTSSGDGGGVRNYRYSNSTFTNCVISGNTSNSSGGGMYIYDNCDPIFTNCEISENTSSSNGGGVLIYDSSPIFSDCEISGDTSSGDGGGLWISRYSYPTFTNCTISGNTSSSNGGGVLVYSGSPIFTDCEISGNTSSLNGGGVYNYTNSSATYTNCTISGNTSSLNGGGVLVYSGSPTFTNCEISGNTGSSGGGVYNYTNSSATYTNCEISGNNAIVSNSWGGGVCNYNSDPSFTNCVISGNTSGFIGGGVYNYAGSTKFTNCTIALNTSSSYGGGIFSSGTVSSNVTFNNTIIWGNSASSGGNEIYKSSGLITLNYSCFANGSNDIYGTVDTNNCINDFPKFSLRSNSYKLALAGNSPCVDAGNNEYCDEEFDIRGPGFPRKLNKSDSTNGTIDIGAYEYKNGTDIDEYFPSIIYVNHAAEGNNDGSSWDDSYLHMQSALDDAVSGDEIWVSEGTYYPTKQVGGTGDRFRALQLKNGVAIYGGFAGDETEREDRDWDENPTILSGDIGTKNDSTDNCYHIFYHPDGLNLSNTAILDGFIIEKANANHDSSDAFRVGAAIYNYKSSPKFANCIIRNHASDRNGGAIFNRISNPAFTNCEISGNRSSSNGGGVLVYSGSPIFTDCEIIGNIGLSGGGVFNYINSSPTFTNCEISGNLSNNYGGGVYSHENSSPTFTNCVISTNTGLDGGGVYNYSSSPSFTNCEISGNNAIVSNSWGGGVCNYNSDPSFTNCVISGNTSGFIGGGVYNYAGSTKFTNCTIALNTSSSYGGGIFSSGTVSSNVTFNNTIIWGNSASSGGNEIYKSSGLITLNYSCFANGSNDIYGTLDTNNCINTNPEFAGEDYIYPFALFGNSLCVDAGNNDYCDEEYDIRGTGFPRKLNKVDGTDGTIDIGAYEYKEGTDPIFICVNPQNGGIIDSNLTICYNTDIIINNLELPSGHSGNIEYKWQISIVSDVEGFDDIPNSNVASIELEQVSQISWLRRLSRVDCENNWDSLAISNVAKVSFFDEFASGIIDSIGETISYEGNPKEINHLTAPSGGDGNYSYKWQRSIVGRDTGFEDIEGAFQASYRPIYGLTQTSWYRRLVKDGSCSVNYILSEGIYEVTVLPKISWLPDFVYYNFGSHLVDDTANVTFRLINDGHVEINIDTLEFSTISFWRSSVTLPYKLLENDTLEITIFFLPNEVKNYSSTLFIRSDVLNQNINFEAMGKFPAIPPVLNYATASPFSDETGVFPEIGDEGDYYEFRVVYSDTANYSPATGYPKVQIDMNGDGEFDGPGESGFAMEEVDITDTSYSNGKEYVLVMKLNNVAYMNHKFIAFNNQGMEAIGYAINKKTGPNVKQGIVDLKVSAGDIEFSKQNPEINEGFIVSAKIHNLSNFEANDVNVRFYYQNQLLYQTSIPKLFAKSNHTVYFTQYFNQIGYYPIKVLIDELNIIQESNELNNFAIRPIIIGDFAVAGSMSATINVTPGSIDSKSNGYIKVFGNAKYDTDEPNDLVRGAEVTIFLKELNQTITTHTNSNGDYTISFRTPTLNGTYTVYAHITDFTLDVTTQDASFCVYSQINNYPNLKASLYLPNGCMDKQGNAGYYVNDYIECKATVENNGNETAENVVFWIYIDGILELSKTINFLAPDESEDIYLFFNTSTVGVHSIEIKVDPFYTIAESNEFDNSALVSKMVFPKAPDLVPKRDYGPPVILYPYLQKPIDGITIHSINVSIHNQYCFTSDTTFVKVYDVYNSVPTLIHTEKLRPLGKEISDYIHVFSIDNYEFDGAGEHRILVIIEELENEWNMDNNTYELIVHVNQSLPDIELINNLRPSITNPTVGDTITLTQDIRNIGTLNADDFHVRFYIDNSLIGQPILVEGLQINEEKSISISWQVTSCPKIFKVTADEENLIEEYYEENKKEFYAREFYSTSWIDNTSPIQIRTTVDSIVKFTPGFGNLGIFDADNVPVLYKIDNIYLCENEIPVIGRHSRTNSLFLNKFTETGTFIVTAEVNKYYSGDKKYCETYFNNNIAYYEVVVIEELPDLQILSEDISPTELNPEKNENINIYASLRNIGKKSTGDFYVNFYVNNSQLGSPVQVSNLNSNDYTTIECPAQYSSDIVGIHVIRVILDESNTVNEITKLNNQATRAVIIGNAPDLTYSTDNGIILNKDNILLEDTVNIQSIIRNRGGDYGEGDLKYYLIFRHDTTLIHSTIIYVPDRDSISYNFDWVASSNYGEIYSTITNVTPTESNLLNNTKSKSFGTHALPFEVNITQSKDTIWIGQSVQFFAELKHGEGNYSIQWSSYPGNIVSNDSIYVISPTEFTTVYMIASDGVKTYTKSFEIKIQNITLLSPLNNDTVDIKPNLQWYSLGQSVIYQLHIDTVSTFNSNYLINIENIESYSYLFANSVYNKKYYWKVRAYYLSDTTDWSDTWVFSTNEAANVPSSWSYTPNTGKNAIIEVPTNIEPKIGERNFINGDAIGFFYTRSEQKVCAGYSIWTGSNIQITVWGDDSETQIKDGFDENETYTVKVWDGQAGKEYEATVTFSQGNSYFTDDGFSVIGSLSAITPFIHDIPLSQGWNLISTYVQPENPALEDVYSDIEQSTVIVKNNFGQIYYPEFEINDIGNWDVKQGYQVYMSQADTLTISGIKVVPETTEIALSAGWNMLAYLRDNAMDIEIALASLVADNKLVIAKDNMGNVFYPAFEINNIGNMLPGQGYQIYMISGGTLVYPEN
jgi:hypothetical protein